MPDTNQPVDAAALRAEIARLRQELDESRETLRAIRYGEVDAVVVGDSDSGPTIMTLGAAGEAYQLIVDQVGHPTAVLSTAGHILQSNALFAALTQRDEDSLKDTPVQDLIVPASAAALAALLTDGQKAETEKELILRNAAGRRVPVTFSVRPLKDHPAGLCLLLTDLTAERMRDRIISEEILAQSILEQVADAIIVCDSSGRIVRASRAVELLIGGNPLNRFVDDAVPLQHAVDGEFQPLTFKSIIDSQESRGWEVTYTGRNGRQSYLLLSAGFLFGTDAEMRGAVLTLTDITERKRVESALELADRRKNEFLAILAHELRNPLAPISNSVSILSAGTLSPDIRGQALGMMDRQVRQMVRLVDDLMDVSRITRGKVELKKERVDLGEALNSAIETSQPLIDQFQHRLTLNARPDPVYVEADFTRLTQIFSNLLNNAAKYSEPEGEITVSVRVDGGEAVIEFADTGIGIKPEMMDHIFDMFAQVDGSLERSHGGLGVGLTLVKTLIEMHGGTISARSPGPGQGSVFTVRLPVMAAPVVAEAAPAEAPKAQSGLRVMIVEDNEALAQTTGWLVEMLGHDYRLSHSANEALEVAPEYLPDVLMMDIGLPGMNGYDLCREMRQADYLADTIFIAQTGWGQEEHRIRAREAGFHHHMVKPIAIESLESMLASIEQAIRGR